MDRIKPTYNFDNSCFYDEEKKIRFEPPVYEQRYLTVLRILELDFWKEHFKKIVEFGCAEMKFFTLLKTLPDVEQILQVDIDEELLNKWTFSVRPLFVDFIQRRPSKFSVEVWRGSISGPHECLKDTDVVIGIEIIEHLFPIVLEQVPQNVFGFMRPKVVMFSTPNSEYNVHFDGLLENGFRHEDHKFEWTRAQFEQWCENICQRYPDYAVKYFGIGPPPKDSADVGYVSQLGVFVRKDFLEMLEIAKVEQNDQQVPEEAVAGTSEAEASNPPVEASQSEPKIYFNAEVGEIVMERAEDDEEANAFFAPRDPETFQDDVNGLESSNEYLEEDLVGSDDDDQPRPRDIDYYIPIERARNDSGNYDDEPLDPSSDEYKLLYSVDYPVQEPDRRERPERLLDEAEYQIRRLKLHEEEYYSYDQNLYLIPLQLVVDCMIHETTTLEEITPILTGASYRITENNMVALNGNDESLPGSEEDFEYDLAEDDSEQHGKEGCSNDENEPQPKNDGSTDGASFQEDEELWD